MSTNRKTDKEMVEFYALEYYSALKKEQIIVTCNNIKWMLKHCVECMKPDTHIKFIFYDFMKNFETRQNRSIGTEMKTMVVRGR